MTDAHIAYLRSAFAEFDEGFYEYLANLSCKDVRVYAPREGSVVFPREPLLRVEGPLAVCQLLETPLLTLINYAALVATNATRMRMAAGKDKVMLEFGLRRAQGPDGGVTASRSAMVGGFDATSNVAAGFTYGIAIKGTHAHAFVSAFNGIADIRYGRLVSADDGIEHNFTKLVLDIRDELCFGATHEGELAAFISYACCYPKNALLLVDTYDTLSSGVLNFLCVATALVRIGYRPVGIRLDSGDLSYLSKECRRVIDATAKLANVDLSYVKIAASNDLNEETIHSLNLQGHSIDVFGIGTHLVTCQKQPALGCVFKLVELNGKPRIKLSQSLNKIPIPGRKRVYRLYGEAGKAICDLMDLATNPPPQVGQKLLARHPFDQHKRVYIIPRKVEELQQLVYDGAQTCPPLTVDAARKHLRDNLDTVREDHLRGLNPTPYKVSVTEALYAFMVDLIDKNAPVQVLA